MSADKLENFRQAFADGCGSSYGTCACGKTYYDIERRFLGGWEPGKDDVPIPGGVSWMSFEGSAYCMDCDCWNARAMQLMRFLEAHGRAIAEFFKREKKRLLAVAESAPMIDDSPTQGGAPNSKGGAA